MFKMDGKILCNETGAFSSPHASDSTTLLQEHNQGPQRLFHRTNFVLLNYLFFCELEIIQLFVNNIP